MAVIVTALMIEASMKSPVLTSLIALLILTGCATVNTPAPDPLLLDFLQDGQTSREEIVLRLGAPSQTMENERVLFYRLAQDKRGYLIREPRHDHFWAGVQISLVLVLDDRGVLQQHSLVNVQ